MSTGVREKIGDIRFWKRDFVLQYLPFPNEEFCLFSLFLDKATTAELYSEACLIKKQLCTQYTRALPTKSRLIKRKTNFQTFQRAI